MIVLNTNVIPELRKKSHNRLQGLRLVADAPGEGLLSDDVVDHAPQMDQSWRRFRDTTTTAKS